MPGMSEMAYNTWMTNLNNKLVGRLHVNKINGIKLPKYTGPNSEYAISANYRFKPDQVECQQCEIAIYRSRLVNRDISLVINSRPCKKTKKTMADWLGN